MRPYLAILKDSFREALSSRVLWILLILSTLVLVAVAPLGIREQAGAYFGLNELTDPKGLLDKIQAQQAAAAPSPGKRVWALFHDNFRERISDSSVSSPWQGNPYYQLRDELNAVLPSRELYDPSAWAGVTLPGEARDLLQRGIDQLADDELPMLNRLLLEAAFPDEISPSRTP
ncbi:MAG TPA: hypothetical protein VFW87_04490, partial [Pirellulales bacterium]|nr:hypothetical protein [Pirellulales bacterium]